MHIPDKILKNVEKPCRYIGGEWGEVIKDKNKTAIRVAFCFPDLYEIGMSNLAIKILYHTLNLRPDTWCERLFAPAADMERQLRENHIPLYALESHDPVRSFDFVAFTIPFELCYTNILNVLDLSGIPLLQSDRSNDDPLIIGGGVCTSNPEPLAQFFDLFCIGEGEELLNEVMDLYARHKKSGFDRKRFLLACQKEIEGIYVPSFYQPVYHDDGTLASFMPLRDDIPKKIRKRIIRDLNHSPYPSQMVEPHCEVTQDHISIETSRGCIRGCRFCQAGMLYRPVREKEVETLSKQAAGLYQNSGKDVISLLSLSISDYTKIDPLLKELTDWTEKKHIHLSFPSLRADSFTKNFIEKTSGVKMNSITFAPEAGSQRLRDVINKNLREEDLLRACSIAFLAGSRRIKLYFMMGLPEETDEDIAGIEALAHKVVDCYFQTNGPEAKDPLITVAISWFNPKAFTPFQWEKRDSLSSISRKRTLLKGLINSPYIHCKFHDIYFTRLEAVFAKGDRKTGDVLLEAHRRGLHFIGDQKRSAYYKWMDVFSDLSIDPAFYAERLQSEDELLCWDFIDVGVTKQFLLREHKKAKEGLTTPNCREHCSGCGALSLKGVGTCCIQSKE